VRRFYGAVRADRRLAPVFDARIDDWEPHLQRMMSFWRTILRGEPGYQPGPKGPPPVVHRAIAELDREHFARWLALFEEVALEVFPRDAAEIVVTKARRMAVALSGHLPA